MPTETLGDRAGTTYAGSADAMLADFDTNTNYSAEASIDNPFLLKFTGLTSITGPVTVTNAVITINCTSGQVGAETWSIKRVLRNWVEAQATWNNYSTGNAWTTAGCLSDGNDRVAGNSCTLSYPGGFATGDVASTANTTLIADVQGIINGTLSNFGWLIDPGVEAVGGPGNATAANRPLLTVTYTASSSGSAGGLIGGKLLRGLIY